MDSDAGAGRGGVRSAACAKQYSTAYRQIRHAPPRGGQQMKRPALRCAREAGRRGAMFRAEHEWVFYLR